MADIHEDITGDSSSLVEALEEAAEAAEPLAEALKQIRDALLALEGASEGLEEAGEELDSVRDKAAETDETVDDLQASFDALVASGPGLGDLAAFLEEDAEAAGSLRDKLGEATDAEAALAAGGASLGDAAPALEADAEAAGSYRDKLGEVGAAQAAVTAEAGGLYATLAQLRDVLGSSELGDSVTVGVTGMNKFAIVAGDADNSARQGAAGIDFLMEAMEKGAGESQAAEQAATALGLSLSDTEDMARNARAALLGLGASEQEAAAGAQALAKAQATLDAASGEGGGFLTGILKLFGGGEGGGGLGSALAGGLSLGGGVAAAYGIAAVMAEIGGLVTGFSAALAGAVPAVLLSLPALEKLKDTYSAISTARAAWTQAEQVAKRDPTKDNVADAVTDAAKLKVAYADIPAYIRPAMTEITGLTSEYKQMAKAFEPDVFHVFNLGLRTAEELLPTFLPLADKAAGGADDLLTRLDKFFKIPKPVSAAQEYHLHEMPPPPTGWQKWLDQIEPDVKPAEEAIGGLISTIVVDWGKFMERFSPKDIENTFHILDNLINWWATGWGHAISDVMNMWDDFSAAFHNVGHWNQEFNTGTAKGLDEARHSVASFAGDVNTELGRLNSDQQKWAASFGKSTADAFKTLASETVADWNYLVSGTKADWDLVSHAVSDATDAVRESVISAGHEIESAWDAAGHAIEADWDAAWARVTSFTESIPGKIEHVFAGAGGWLVAAGRDVVEGLVRGMESGLGDVEHIASEIGSVAESAARWVLGSHSPSKVFEDIGKDTVAGFVLGLEGGKTAVQNAIDAVLNQAAPYHNTAIQDMISKMRDEVEAAAKAGVIGPSTESRFSTWLAEDNHRLQGLAEKRADLENEIKAADSLAASVQSAQISASTVTSAFGMTYLGQAAQAPEYASIKQALQGQLAQTRQFREDIEKLKKEGLGEASIQSLLAAGVSGGLPVATQLLSGGRAGVKQINELEAQIAAASKQLGITGANASYESGAEIGKGLAAGLRSELKTIDSEMEKVADELVGAIRRALRISSPSGVMMDIGSQLGEGLIAGMEAKRTAVAAAGERMGMSATGFLPARSYGGGASGFGGDVPPIEIHLTSVSTLDGKQVARSVQKYTLQHARRNTKSGLQLQGRGV
jgi:hypothetical protein